MHLTEERVTEAILQRETKVTICGRDYMVSPPTPATLIMVSQYTATLPAMQTDKKSNVLHEVLTKARDAEAIGKICATLILGAKRINQHRKIRVGWFKRRDEFEFISNYIMDNLTTNEVAQIISQRLLDMEVGDFFALTASLSDVNITKPTRAAETQYGE